jgi:AhpD family alkylhydroperoxidase
MKAHVKITEVQPEAYQAMLGLEHYVKNSGLTDIHRELIKIRASQLNGCAFCIYMHTTDAMTYGETPQRIFLLNAWEETDLFDEKEKAVLALTDAITRIHGDIPAELIVNARKYFDETYLAQIIMAIITINAWNRIGILSGAASRIEVV